MSLVSLRSLRVIFIAFVSCDLLSQAKARKCGAWLTTHLNITKPPPPPPGAIHPRDIVSWPLVLLRNNAHFSTSV